MAQWSRALALPEDASSLPSTPYIGQFTVAFNYIAFNYSSGPGEMT